MLKKIKDPASALTHFAGCVMAALAAVPLLCKAAREPGRLYFIAMAVFALSMVLLYAASTTYHTVDSTDKVNRRLRKLDHMMIFVLIAGSYTPICLITLRGPQGTALCAAVWAVALAGIAIKALWITCPKWFSSVLYIAMGWLCVFAVVPIVNALSPAGLAFGGRHHLHGGRRALCAEASVVQCAPQGVWHARNFPCVRHGGQRLPLCADVLFCHARFGIVPGLSFGRQNSGCGPGLRFAQALQNLLPFAPVGPLCASFCMRRPAAAGTAAWCCAYE